MSSVSCLETAEPPPGYRPCVGIFLLEPAGLAFVGQRRDMPRATLGRCRRAASTAARRPAVAARREMLEEIGTDRAELLRESRIWRSYDLPAELARRLWRGRYRGQTQRWLAFRFTGSDADIRLDDAASGVQRLALGRRRTTCRELIVPFKRDVYVSVVAEFRPLWA